MHTIELNGVTYEVVIDNHREWYCYGACDWHNSFLVLKKPVNKDYEWDLLICLKCNNITEHRSTTPYVEKHFNTYLEAKGLTIETFYNEIKNKARRIHAS